MFCFEDKTTASVINGPQGSAQSSSTLAGGSCAAPQQIEVLQHALEATRSRLLDHHCLPAMHTTQAL